MVLNIDGIEVFFLNNKKKLKMAYHGEKWWKVQGISIEFGTYQFCIKLKEKITKSKRKNSPEMDILKKC